MSVSVSDKSFARQCGEKISYDYWLPAHRAAAAMLGRTGEQFEPYKCPYCHSWHIGHAAQNRQNGQSVPTITRKTTKKAISVAESTLRDELTMNQEHIEVLTARNAELEARACACWWCRFKNKCADTARKAVEILRKIGGKS